MTAGFAAAEVKFSGSASMGVARQGGTDAVAAVAGTMDTYLLGVKTAGSSAVTSADVIAAQLAYDNALAAKEAKVALEAIARTAYLAANAAGRAAALTALDAATLATIAADAVLADRAAELAARNGTPAVASIAAGDFQVYNSATLDIAATVVSDAGVEFGMSTDVSFGNSYSFADDDGFATEGGTIGAPTLTAKGAFGTLTFADDGIDQLYSDATAGDFSYAYSAGDLSVTMVSDVNGSTGVEWSANAAYTMSGVAMSLTSDSTESYAASIGYTSGGITGTIDTDYDATALAPEAVNTLTVAYAANGMSVELSADSTDYSSIAVGYSANGLAVNVSTDTDDAWEATTSYDLGGGASFVAGVNYTEDAYAGVDLTF